MDVGVITGSLHGLFSETVDVAVLAEKAESLGFESFWMPEHTIVPVNYASTYEGRTILPDWGDPLIGLARVSAVTQSIKLGTAISLVPENNPLLQAKQIATLDRLSNGRFIFGHRGRMASRRNRDHGRRLEASLGANQGGHPGG